MKPVADYLGNLMGKPVAFATDCIGPAAEEAAKALKPGDVLVLENTRYHNEEEANDPEFSRQLASLAELYVNDAFGSAHRAHASTEGVTKYLPGVSGFLMEKRSSTWDRRSITRNVRLLPYWAVQRSAIRSVSSRICSPKQKTS